MFAGEESLVVNRLMLASGTPEVKRAMEVEDEILSEIEERDTAIMMRDKVIESKDKEIESKDKEIESKDKEIESKDKEIESKDKEIDEKNLMIREMARMLHDQGIPMDVIAQRLNIDAEMLKGFIEN